MPMGDAPSGCLKSSTAAASRSMHAIQCDMMRIAMKNFTSDAFAYLPKYAHSTRFKMPYQKHTHAKPAASC